MTSARPSTSIIHGLSYTPDPQVSLEGPYAASLPVEPKCTSFSMDSPSLMLLVFQRFLISLARFTMLSFLAARTSSIDSRW